MTTLETHSPSLQYDWLYSQDLPDPTWYAKSNSEDDYLQLVAFILDARLRTLHGPGKRNAWLIWNGTRWCRVDQDFARGVFYAACWRLAEITSRMVSVVLGRPKLSEMEAEEQVRTRAIEEGTRVPEGAALKRKVKEMQMDEIDQLIYSNCQKILAFIRNDLFSTKGKQYAYWFRKFSDDHRLCEPVTERQLDQGNYINFLNGVYHADIMEFVPHGDESENKNLMLTRQAPVNYIPWHDSYEEEGLLKNWLSNINIGDRLFLQCYLGHSLSGINIEKVFTTVTGDGDTGKSSISAAVFGTFGKDTEDGYIHAAQLRSFRRSTYISPGSPRPDIVSMLDARLTIVPETEGVEVSAEIVKQLLSGGADYTGERDLWASSSSGINRSGIMFIGNSMPFFDQSDKPLMDRHFAIELSSLKKSDIRSDFNDRLAKDETFKERFASWVVQGYEIFRSNEKGFRGTGATIVPLAGIHVKSSSRMTKNVIHEWALDCLAYTEDLPPARPEELYQSFNAYRKSHWGKPVRKGYFLGNLQPYLDEVAKKWPCVHYDRSTSKLKGVVLRRRQL